MSSREVTDIYITRFGYLNARKIDKIVRRNPHVNNSKYLQHRSYLIDYQGDAQYQTLQYFMLHSTY